MDESQMKPTKVRILDTAIDLFSEKGYRDVSVRDIAFALGIKASSLYKHYESKDAILEDIFNLFRRKVEETDFPVDNLQELMKSLDPETYLDMAFERFKQVMWTDEILKISKIITMEQQRSQSVREFFTRELVEKPNEMMKNVLDLMVQSRLIKPADTRVLAEEYNAYIVYLYFEQNFLKEGPSLEEIDRKMKRHNAFFAQHVFIRGEER